jgi:hypothetical protein
MTVKQASMRGIDDFTSCWLLDGSTPDDVREPGP